MIKEEMDLKTKQRIVETLEWKNMYPMQIIKKMKEEFNLNNVEAGKLWNFRVKHKKRLNISKEIKKQSKTIDIPIKKNKCYFCPSKERLLEHHISYNPPVKKVLCESCHQKLHHIIKEYHNKEIKFNLFINKLKDNKAFSDYVFNKIWKNINFEEDYNGN